MGLDKFKFSASPWHRKISWHWPFVLNWPWPLQGYVNKINLGKKIFRHLSFKAAFVQGASGKTLFYIYMETFWNELFSSFKPVFWIFFTGKILSIRFLLMHPYTLLETSLWPLFQTFNMYKHSTALLVQKLVSRLVLLAGDLNAFRYRKKTEAWPIIWAFLLH